jgi:hypothetical protein
MKLFLLAFLYTPLAFAFFPHQNLLMDIEVNFYQQDKTISFYELQNTNDEVAKIAKYLEKNQEFGGEGFDPKVIYFWYLVYSKLSSNQVIIHGRDDITKIHKILDFSHLKLKNEADFHLIYLWQIKATQNEIEKIQKNNPRSEHLRSQTGQKNKFEKGIERAADYKIFLNTVVKMFDLPVEILALSFLESNFDPKAQSRVGAGGLWQLMPSVAAHYLKNPEHRFSPTLSTLAAFHLIKENYAQLNDWGLSILSYNSGAFYIKNLMKEHTGLSIHNIFDRLKDNDHFGFATKNFYLSFLAINYYLSQNSFWPKVEDTISLHLNHCSNEIVVNNVDPQCTKKINAELIRRKYPKNWNL